MRPLPGDDIWRSVDLLRDLVNDIHRRVRSLEERQPPQRTEVSRHGDEFRVGDVVYHVDYPHVKGEVIGFSASGPYSGGRHLVVKVLTDAKRPQEYWPVGSCRFSAPPDPRRDSGTPSPWVPPHDYVTSPPPPSPVLSTSHDREEVLVALVRRAANEIRDGQARRDLLADLEALLAEKT